MTMARCRFEVRNDIDREIVTFWLEEDRGNILLRAKKGDNVQTVAIVNCENQSLEYVSNRHIDEG